MGIIPKDKGIVKQVNIAMYNYQVEALDMLSEENGLGRSHYLRVIIDLLIKQYESKQEIEQRARELSKESEEEKIEKIEDKIKELGLKAYKKELENDYEEMGLTGLKAYRKELENAYEEMGLKTYKKELKRDQMEKKL